MPPVSKRRSKANLLACSLAAKFLENGNYEALGVPLSPSTASKYTQAASTSSVEPFFEEESGFSGLFVHSVGYTAGAEEEEVVIYVTRGSRKSLDSISQEIGGIRVRAAVLGRIKAGPAPAASAQGLANLFERNNRIAYGSSCAPSNQTYAGTLGTLLRQNGRLMGLSNNHVFAACNHTPVGMPILSPSSMDARPGRRGPTEILRYTKMVELRSGDPALVPSMKLDAAVANVVDESRLSSWQGDELSGFDTPASTVDPSFDLRVKKVGRTTGATTGVCKAFVPTPWILPYKSGKFSATVWFSDTWTVRSDDSDPFALPGDSGSLVVTEDGSSAVGLLFAVNNKGQYGIIMPIKSVLQEFENAVLVSNHGV